MTRCLLHLLIYIALVACAATRHSVPTAPRTKNDPPPASRTNNSAKTAPYQVLGQRYYPVTDANGYRERGVASWYGGKFHGRATANGERYDMHQYTAAHKTLPLPTWVRVTNLRNGTSVIVRVNDRGPFVKNRLIDLSYAAAQRLNMVGDGTTLVEVEVIDPVTVDTSTIVPAVTTPTTSLPADRQIVAVDDPAALDPQLAMPQKPQQEAAAPSLFVQVGAFGDLGNAERLRTTLYNAGIVDVRLASADLGGTIVHRVQIGPVLGVVEYDVLMARLDSLGINDTHLVTDQ
ncbi:MAG: septal ring lytic transglycosylase RlpA family protein [Gammaproteobacteria bacterium]|nr:septal ring lytic transglycosylase RlpA family protein [Gammaproteobacteria bacterium]